MGVDFGDSLEEVLAILGTILAADHSCANSHSLHLAPTDQG